LRKYSIEPHVIMCLSVEEVLNRTSCVSTSSTEIHIITWGSIEYFLNWETNNHMRFYWVLPQLRDKLSHEVLLSTSSTERQIITWGSIEYFLNMWWFFSQLRKYSIEPHVIIYLSVEEVLNRTSCDNFSLSWGSTQ
jgi:hypothetical protein